MLHVMIPSATLPSLIMRCLKILTHAVIRWCWWSASPSFLLAVKFTARKTNQSKHRLLKMPVWKGSCSPYFDNSNPNLSLSYHSHGQDSQYNTGNKGIEALPTCHLFFTSTMFFYPLAFKLLMFGLPTFPSMTISSIIIIVVVSYFEYFNPSIWKADEFK